MPRLRRRRQSIRRLVTASAVSLILAGSAGWPAAATPGQPVQPVRPEPTAPLLGLADELLDDLGLANTGGAYVDGDRLVVTLVDPDSGSTPDHHDIRTRRVQHSIADLEQAKQNLDRFAGEHGAGQVQSWHVDVRQNALLINAPAGSHDQATRGFLRHAERGYGDMIKIVETDGEVRPAGRNLYDSDSIALTNGMECSVGFNARTSSGRMIFLTAGHCLRGGATAYRGSYVGHSVGGRYPGSDFGAVLLDTSRWNPKPAVTMRNGMARAVLGTAEPLVGSQVCKSSAISGWTCGRIEATDQTVNYGNGNLVYGLVRFNGCVEPGDSGGAVMYGNDAVGILSGAQFHDLGRSQVCGQRLGKPNVSFYQPIRPALRAMDAQLLTYQRTNTNRSDTDSSGS